jgi:hypothetical protein
MAQKDPQKQFDKHAMFCNKVGIEEDSTEQNQMKPVDGGFYRKVLKKYKRETRRYWFIATTIHTLYLLQIILGATATAVSVSKVPTAALTVLTAIVTVVAGILAFITGHGHPGRARQLRNNLREVCDYIRFTEMEYRDPAQCDSAQCDQTVKNAMKEVKEAVEEVKRLYYAAWINAETTYPNTWSIGAKLAPKKEATRTPPSGS